MALGAMTPLREGPPPPGSLTIVALAHGFRVDVIAVHDASGEIRRLEPVHYPTLGLARQFANLMAKATGCPIEERIL